MHQVVSSAFDPAWYLRELAQCSGAVLVAYVRDGVLVGLAELYPSGMRITDGGRLIAARQAFQRSRGAMRRVGDFCIHAGLVHSI
jgi:predicted GNAT superfamily acetyltransferase